MIKGIIFDWAGTTIDFGCFAPVKVFVDIFKDANVEVTIEEARRPMGMLKIDHIRTMLEMERIKDAWTKEYGKAPNESDVQNLYQAFETSLMKTLSQYTTPIPHVVETVNQLRADGLKIGSTTGYTAEMMKVVSIGATKNGYKPDMYVTAEDVNGKGRPYPYMIFENIKLLGLQSVKEIVKVGDTISDIHEGVNAGVWTVGVIEGSSVMGYTKEEYNALSPNEQQQSIEDTKKQFLDAGAHYTILNLSELPKLIQEINQL